MMRLYGMKLYIERLCSHTHPITGRWPEALLTPNILTAPLIAQETMAAIQQYTDIKDVEVLQYGTYMVLGSNSLKKTKKTADALGNIGKV